MVFICVSIKSRFNSFEFTLKSGIFTETTVRLSFSVFYQRRRICPIVCRAPVGVYFLKPQTLTFLLVLAWEEEKKLGVSHC